MVVRFGAAGLVLLLAYTASAQVQSGELRVHIADPSGLPLPCALLLVSEASRTHRDVKTSDSGDYVFQHLPFGVYRLSVNARGFAAYARDLEIRSAVPAEVRLRMALSSASTQIVVKGEATILDPARTGVDYAIGGRQLTEEQSPIPGRAVLDLVDDQPGWLFEANGVLHPRGSEYQTQFVVDGMPLEENRSPGFAPGFDSNDVTEMTVITGNIPAEYGRKLGGIVEVTTSHDVTPGFHGSAAFSGGSFDSEAGFAQASYGWAGSELSADLAGSRTDRYLDPPALGNFTNAGSLESGSVAYSTDLPGGDRLFFLARQAQSRFEVPNENLQQAAGQRQDRTTPEASGEASWAHVFSGTALLNVRGSVEDLSANLWSNALATPVIAAQQRGFRRSYLNATLSIQKGRHDLQFGGDAIYAPVSEALQYAITDASLFDLGTPPAFQFTGHRLDREQALFAQDGIRFGRLTVSAGLRWDHYSLVVRDHAFSPRLGVAYFFPRAGLLLRFSYDRAFQTPAMENLLLASSPAVDQLSPEVLRLPVRPSRGNYLETGFSQAIANRARLDVSFYRRTFVDYADDDVFLNTGIGFPIAFRGASIQGIDAKLDLPHWGKLSGFLSYSNMLGIATLPVTGGLFLGSDAEGVLGPASAFPISQDQRNTARARARYQLTSRAWAAMSAEYGSGLPVEIDGDSDPSDLESQYGSQIVSRVNFSAGRVRPNFSLDAEVGAEVWKREKASLKIEGEIDNLTNRVNVIDFAGLFSGTAVGPGRSGSLRLTFSF